MISWIWVLGKVVEVGDVVLLPMFVHSVASECRSNLFVTQDCRRSIIHQRVTDLRGDTGLSESITQGENHAGDTRSSIQCHLGAPVLRSVLYGIPGTFLGLFFLSRCDPFLLKTWSRFWEC